MKAQFAVVHESGVGQDIGGGFKPYATWERLAHEVIKAIDDALCEW
jgi:hypothetical protein